MNTCDCPAYAFVHLRGEGDCGCVPLSGLAHSENQDPPEPEEQDDEL